MFAFALFFPNYTTIPRQCYVWKRFLCVIHFLYFDFLSNWKKYCTKIYLKIGEPVLHYVPFLFGFLEAKSISTAVWYFY